MGFSRWGRWVLADAPQAPPSDTHFRNELLRLRLYRRGRWVLALVILRLTTSWGFLRVKKHDGNNTRWF